MQDVMAKRWRAKLTACWGPLHSLPVHEVYQHLRVLLVLLHLDGVREDHVQVEHKVLDLEAHGAETLSYCFPTTGGLINQFGKLNQS